MKTSDEFVISLGAGTAVILSFMLRLKYNSVKCFAFGPPGGLLNSQAYAISTTFVTSVVVGDDIICRYVHEAFLAISWRLYKSNDRLLRGYIISVRSHL